MKNLSKLVFTILLVSNIGNVMAQDQNNPWAINLGANAIDVYPVGESAPQGDYLNEYFNVGDHWSILPSLSTLSVSKYVGDGFSVQVGGSINQIKKWGQNSTSPSLEVDNLAYYAIDGNVRYHFANLINSNKIDPTIGFGGGYTWIEEGAYNTLSVADGSNNLVGAGTANASLGLTYWFSENIGLFVESKYKHSFEDYLTKHFQHSAGIAVRFGGTDTDGDGVYDKYDACPEVFGLEAFNGCPDADGDGIEDAKDTCPNEAGLMEFNGCPDTDGDGISDNEDNCPEVAGLKALSGCPDTDGDGVTDTDDKCPNEAGPSANNGCPWADTDNDGVTDNIDKCPSVAGTVANDGCPEIVEPTQEVMEQLNSYAKTILFGTGKSSFEKQSYSVLQSITAILKEYPKSNFTIEGHTDSVGSKTLNQKLSDARANGVMGYLVKNGVDADRLSAFGLGEDYPIDTNATAAGRRNNRRVEVKLKKD